MQGKIEVTYVDVPPVLVEQFNMISNFGAGGRVESLLVPFLCKPCKSTLFGKYTAEALKQAQLQLAPAKCPTCGGEAEFDDFPEEYFAFLQR